MNPTLGMTLKRMREEEFRRCLSDYAHALKTGEGIIPTSLKVHRAARNAGDRARINQILKPELTAP